jgi:hypothetical protein
VHNVDIIIIESTRSSLATSYNCRRAITKHERIGSVALMLARSPFYTLIEGEDEALRPQGSPGYPPCRETNADPDSPLLDFQTSSPDLIHTLSLQLPPLTQSPTPYPPLTSSSTSQNITK